MNTLTIKQAAVDNETPDCSISFNWADNPDVRHLLDTISSIIANEYITIAKKSPDVFKSEIASSPLAPRNDKTSELEGR